MREHTNLAWPETPFGADKRPFPRHVRLIAATAVQWADNGEWAVPAAVALVQLPVRRTAAVCLDASTLHFGYRVAVIDSDDDSPEAASLVDGYLVQARRHAAAVAVRCWLDDADALGKWTANRAPGITSVTEAWKNRPNRERGTAPLVETCPEDDAATSPLPIQCRQQGISLRLGHGGLLRQNQLQAAYDTLTGTHPAAPADARDVAAQALGVSAVHHGLAVALLAGKQIDRCTWRGLMPVDQVVAAVAWDEFPLVLSEAPALAVTGG